MTASNAARWAKSYATLETELRPKADSQIVMRAIQKVNVVADFGSNSDRTGERLETSARIHRESRGAAGEPD